MVKRNNRYERYITLVGAKNPNILKEQGLAIWKEIRYDALRHPNFLQLNHTLENTRPPKSFQRMSCGPTNLFMKVLQ